VREAKPWFRKFDGWWYVEIAGKQIKLARGRENRPEAVKQFHLLMAGTTPVKPTARTAEQVCDLYLQHSATEHEADTFAWQKRYLQAFTDRLGRVKAADLIPYHLTSWIDAHPGWKGARRHATAIVKRAFAWAVEQKLIAADPFAGVKIPKGGRRDRILTADEREQIFGAIKDRRFRDFVLAMQETGCRPGEVARVTAADVDLDLGVWVLKQHKTARKTGKPRVVYLTPAMIELSTRLVAEFPTGPIFRGPRGRRPFTRNGVRCRFRRLREKLPHLAGVVAYTFRHTYCTEALVNGVGVAQVAELMGHVGTDMVTSVYSKLSQQVAHLRDAARKATGA
jgi:integrase